MKKVLLDSNIVVHREAARVVNKDIGILFYWVDRLGYRKCIHRRTVEEFMRLKAGPTKEAMAIKLQSYVDLKIESPLDPTVQQVCEPMDTDENDRTDTILVNELYVGRVDLLITEDKKMHEKGRRLGLSTSIFKIGQFIEKCIAENPGFSDYKTLSVKKELIGNVDVSDEFFNSLRGDYPGFDQWFVRKSEEEAYVCRSKDGLTAFMYLKVETDREPYPDIQPPFHPKRRLKIGTLKVAMSGYRIGERLLKVALENAIVQRVDEVYVTIYDKPGAHAQLIDLFREFGFRLHGKKGDGELVYVREMKKEFKPQSLALTYPYFSRTSRVFLVPIYPEYHTELLPDSILNTESPRDFVEHQPHRNAIRKVYISRSLERGIQTGDDLVFYRTSAGGPAYYESVVTTVGIVESIVDNIETSEDFIRECRRRSVFTDEELLKHWNYRRGSRPFVVNFLYAYSFPKRPNLQRLIEMGVIASVSHAPRGFTRISSEQFASILEESETDARFVVD